MQCREVRLYVSNYDAPKRIFKIHNPLKFCRLKVPGRGFTMKKESRYIVKKPFTTLYNACWWFQSAP